MLMAEACKFHVQISAREYGLDDGDIRSLPPPVAGKRCNHGWSYVGQRCAQQHRCVMSRRTLHGGEVKRGSTALNRPSLSVVTQCFGCGRTNVV